MWSKSLLLAICSMTVLATSFCTQKQKVREVSSGEDVADFQGPQIVDAEVGELQIYYKVHEHPVGTTTMLVKYLCDPKGEPVVMLDTMVAHFEGASTAFTWRELAALVKKPVAELIKPSELHEKKSVVVLKYYELQMQDLLNPTKEGIEPIMKQSKIDLAQWCKTSR